MTLTAQPDPMKPPRPSNFNSYTMTSKKNQTGRLDPEEQGHSVKPKRSRRVMVTLAMSIAILFSLTCRMFWVDYQISFSKGEMDNAVGLNSDFDWYALKSSENIVWTTCYAKHKCARLSLPLDYLSQDGPRTEIALRMIPATDKKNYKGTIIINPGGPGASGTAYLGRAGDKISTIVGPEFDVLAFDPRGTGATTPLAQCFGTDSQFQIWNLQEGPLLNSTADSVSIARSREKVVSELCETALGGNGKEEVNGTAAEWGPGRFMSTTSVATDMLHIVEKLGQEKLQYWGFSYGTTIGQYFATMYPDKVGRLILDGAGDANPARPLAYPALEDTDAVLASFFTFCHQAGPKKCSLYGPTVTAIQKRVDEIFTTLEQAPIPIPFSSKGPVILTRKMLHEFMFLASYAPLKHFVDLADLLAAIDTHDMATLTNLTDTHLTGSVECNCKETSPWLGANEGFYAIACGEAEDMPQGPDAYDAYFEELATKSRFAAPLEAITFLQCENWKLTAKWKYPGPFASNNTSHPLLIVSSRYDPVSPLRKTYDVQKNFKGSGLLVQNSYGHCSPSGVSLCTAKYVREYFRDGTLPPEGTVCDVDEQPFVGRVGDNLNTLSREDERLLEALKGLVIAVPRFGYV